MLEYNENPVTHCGGATTPGYAYKLGDRVGIIDSIDGDSFIVEQRGIKNQCVKIDGEEQIITTYMYAPIDSSGFYPEQCLVLYKV